MVNNRSKSLVRDMKWSADGLKVCIIYEDGHVILGNVDGKRIWGKDLKTKLSNVEWSPDGRLLLFGTKDGKVNIHDYLGNFLSSLHIWFDPQLEGSSLVGIDWFSKAEGYDSRIPTLAVALCNGKIQMMRHELDEEPILIDTKMNITCVKWSPNGEVLGVVGSEKPQGPINADVSLSVQLYSHYGTHLRTLHVPGKKISTLAWEGGGLKLALAVDSYIYLANIRPEYKWTFFDGSTCAYGFQKKGSEDYCVIFWNINSGKSRQKFVKGLIGICGHEEYCVISTLGDESDQYFLSLCNSFGQSLAFKATNVEPLFLAMNNYFVFVSSDSSVGCWDYRSSLHGSPTEPASTASETSPKTDDSQIFHLDSHVRLAPFQTSGWVLATVAENW